MKKTILVSLFLVATIALYCVAAGMPEFSADMIVKTKSNTMLSKIYFSNNKIRTETDKSIGIIRMDKNVMWTLMPAQKMYMESKFDPQKAPVTTEKVPGEVSRVKLGNEKINGVACTKYKVTYKDNKKTTQSYQWMSSDNIPMKTAAIDGSWSTEYKNLKKGKVDPSLFEVPKGYSKFSMPAIPKY